MARTASDLPRLTGRLEPRGAWTASACSLARALDVVSTRSAFLLLREAFYGTARFDDFAERAGVSEPVAAARLRELVGAGLLTREEYREPGQRARLAYRLTDKGADLFPALAALMQWGDRWLSSDGGPIGLRHRDCGEPVEVELRCAAGHRTGPAELDLTYRHDRREARLPGALAADLALDAGQHRGHAAQPQRADQVVQPQLAGEFVRGGQHLVRTEAVQPSLQDAGEPACGRRLRRRVEEQVHHVAIVHLNREEQRRLALGHLFQQVPPVRVALRESRKVVGELQQQLEPLLAGHRREVVDDLRQARVQRPGGHGVSPRLMGTRTLFPHSVQDPS
jgi:DNA-binding HxlR family transcriptional regulator